MRWGLETRAPQRVLPQHVFLSRGKDPHKGMREHPRPTAQNEQGRQYAPRTDRVCFVVLAMWRTEEQNDGRRAGMAGLVTKSGVRCLGNRLVQELKLNEQSRLQHAWSFSTRLGWVGQ